MSVKKSANLNEKEVNQFCENVRFITETINNRLDELKKAQEAFFATFEGTQAEQQKEPLRLFVASTAEAANEKFQVLNKEAQDNLDSTIAILKISAKAVEESMARLDEIKKRYLA